MRNPFRFVSLALAFGLAVFLAGCSVPTLEAPECTASRGAAKELYSIHFGNDMAFSVENLKLREKFLTPEFAAAIRNSPDGADPLTTGDQDFPKAFRIGGCKVVDAGKCDVEILLFWKTDTRAEQRPIHVQVVKSGDQWLIDKVIR